MTKQEILTWLEDFTHTDTGDVKRKDLIHYARKGDSGAFTALGYKQEDVSAAKNYDTETITDVLGQKYTTINDKDETLEYSAQKLNKNHSAFVDEAIKYTEGGFEEDLNDYELLYVYSWLKDENGNMLARKVTGVTLMLDNIGGSSYATADLTFSGIGTGEYGYVASLTNPTFVPADNE